jgi:hypothetical protein
MMLVRVGYSMWCRGRDVTTMRRILIAAVIGAAAAIGLQRHDLIRYLKIKQMSLGTGHPENVPANGSHRYPAAGRGGADGRGDFDAARRGGPAL